MSKVDVSIIIPVYNQNSSLNITLNKFNNQTYNNELFEVIVIDDGSEEEAEKYILEKNIPFSYEIRFIRQKNQGRAKARNTGIQYAQGDILIFNDADRFPASDFICKHMEHYKDNTEKIVVVGCSYDYFGSYKQQDKIMSLNLEEIEKRARKPVFYSKITEMYNNEKIAESKVRWVSYLVGNSSVRKVDVQYAGGFDDTFSIWGAEHFDLAIRMVEQNFKFYLCEEAKNFHIPHKREENFYNHNIDQSVNLLVNKYGEKYNYLRNLLLGEINIEKFEELFTKDIRTPSLSTDISSR